MPMQLKFKLKEKYLHVYATGKWTTDAAKDVIQKIRKAADNNKLNLILIDCKNVTKPDSEMTRYNTGKAIASHLGHPIKTVVVIPIELINKFVENVAVNRGATFFVTDSNDDAIKWLGLNTPDLII